MDTTHSQLYLRDQIMKWRKERQARLAARILRNRQVEVSSAIFGGTATPSGATTGSTDTKSSLPAAPIPKRKPCTKPKTRPGSTPKIKHTKTSRLRMIKANPLLETRGFITLRSDHKQAVNPSVGRSIDQLNAVQSSAVQPSLQHEASLNLPNYQKNQITSVNSVTNDRRSGSYNPLPIKQNSSLRRSLSVGPPVRSAASKVDKALTFRRIQSVANFQDVENTVTKENEQLDCGGDVFSSLPFTQTIYQTPHKTRSELSLKSVDRIKLQSSLQNIYGKTPDIMRKDLSDWLHKRGKSLGNFRHLHCFGIHASNTAYGTVNAQNHKPEVNYRVSKQIKAKENYASSNELSLSRSEQKTCSYEEHTGTRTAEENKENTCVRHPDLLVQDAVKDLLNIIHLGYPWDRCEEWLTMIRKFSPGVKETSIYWECLAALEGGQGDFNSAVDCYEKAIIQGASPTTVGESLDQLLEKFNMLNLSCDFGSDRRNSVRTPHAEILDARNIFKSRVIKFALGEENLKGLKCNSEVEVPAPHYIVTPVRRSTRTSLFQYRTTPGLQCVDSLTELEPSVRKSMVFRPNHALDF